MKKASNFQRVAFSVYGAVLFNFGTVLFWATTKSLLPGCPYMRSTFGVGAAVLFYYIGKEYLDWVDKQVIHSEIEE